MARPSTNGGKQRVGAKAWAADFGGRPAGLLLPEGVAETRREIERSATAPDSQKGRPRSLDTPAPG